MTNRFIITSSVGAWEFGEWRIIGETLSPSDETLMPSLTEEGIEELARAPKLEDYEPGAGRDEVMSALGKAAKPIEKPEK